MLRGAAYSRPFPYRRENEQGPRRSPRRRIAPHGERGPGTATEEVALAPAQTGRESEGRAALPPPRPSDEPKYLHPQFQSLSACERSADLLRLLPGIRRGLRSLVSAL